METERLLFVEINNEVKCLREMLIGTEEYKVAVDGITKLLDRLIEIRSQRQTKEDKARELALDRTLQWVRVAIDIAGITIPVIVVVWGTIFTLKFEETGIVTTMMGKNFVGRLLMKCMKI